MTKKQSKVELLSGQRQNAESDNAVVACNDWLRLGIGRKLTILAQRYTEPNSVKPPTTALQTLKDWSMKYDWSDRATAYDAAIEAEKEVERREVFSDGLARDYERVRKLLRMADFLEGQIYEQGVDGVYHNVWVPDVKSIGSGEFAERVDIERFNAPIFDQYRGVLDDIAKETGGRIKKTDVTSGGEKLKGYIGFSPDEWDADK